MELFGTNFSITLGAWKLRFVLMLEETDDFNRTASTAARTPHHVHASQDRRANV